MLTHISLFSIPLLFEKLISAPYTLELINTAKINKINFIFCPIRINPRRRSEGRIFPHAAQVHIHGVGREFQFPGHDLHRVFDLEDVALPQPGNDLPVAVGGADAGVRVHLLLGFEHRMAHQLLGVFGKGLADARFQAGGRLGGEGGQQLRQRGVQVEIDTQQADHPAAGAPDGDGGGLQRFALFVAGKIGDVAVPALLLDPGEHGEGQVGDGRARLAAGVVAVDDPDHRAVHVFQAVQHDLIAGAEVIRQALHQGGIGVQNAAVLLGQNDFFAGFAHGVPSLSLPRRTGRRRQNARLCFYDTREEWPAQYATGTGFDGRRAFSYNE